MAPLAIAFAVAMTFAIQGYQFGHSNHTVYLLDALHLRWVALLRSMDAADFRRGLRHPEHGRVLTLDQMLGLYAWHGRHHVAHITELRRRSMRFGYEIVREADGTVIAEGETCHVVTDANSRVRTFPQGFAELLLSPPADVEPAGERVPEDEPPL